jgi:dipeptidyl aminopeptidase/acylaminoacyl peptidase
MVALTAGKPGLEPTGDATPYAGISSAVRCVANFYGITNILTRRETDKQGNPTEARQTLAGAISVHRAAAETDPVLTLASPVTHVARSSPPMLTLHGRADATVDYLQAEELHRVARERGASHELVILDGVGHTFDLQTWAKKPLPRDLRPEFLAFLAKHLK